MINAKDISVVIQGQSNTNTFILVNKLRSIWPGCEIIFSTYIDQSVPEGVDTVVINEDPGAEIQHARTKTLNNINRQIRTTKNGLNKVTRKYTIKLRSDLIIENGNILKVFEEPKESSLKSHKIFEKKICVSLLYSRRYYRGIMTPFHISDWYYFGLTSDVKKFFSLIDEVDEPHFTKYFLGKKSPFGSTTFRYAPEQYFTYSAYKKCIGHIEMNDAFDVTADTESESDKFVISNFKILKYKESGIYNSKYLCSKNETDIGADWFGLWTKHHIQKARSKYISHANISLDNNEEILYKNKELYSIKWKIIKHKRNIKERTLPKKLIEVLVLVKYYFSYFIQSVKIIIRSKM